MKRILIASLISVTALFSGCQLVAPNTAGVLMESYGKNGKAEINILKRGESELTLIQKNQLSKGVCLT